MSTNRKSHPEHRVGPEQAVTLGPNQVDIHKSRAISAFAASNS